MQKSLEYEQVYIFWYTCVWIRLLIKIVFQFLGSTPLKMYAKLVEYYKAGKVSFKYVKTFNMDEYVGLPRAHHESYHYFMFNNLFKVNINLVLPLRSNRVVKNSNQWVKLNANIQEELLKINE